MEGEEEKGDGRTGIRREEDGKRERCKKQWLVGKGRKRVFEVTGAFFLLEDFSICSPTLDRQDCSPRDWPPFSMATKRSGAGGSDVVPSPERKSSSFSSSSSHSLSLAFLVCECVCVCDHVRKEKTEDPPNPLDGGENSLPAHKDGRLGTHSIFWGGEGHA